MCLHAQRAKSQVREMTANLHCRNCNREGRMRTALRTSETTRGRPSGSHSVRATATRLPRRRILTLAAGAAALSALSRIAWAQAWPSRPVRIVVGFAAGGGSDITARLIGQWLSEQQFVIE